MLKSILLFLKSHAIATGVITTVIVGSAGVGIPIAIESYNLDKNVKENLSLLEKKENILNNESKKEIINHIEIDNLQNTTIVKLISNDMLFIDYKEINIRVLNDSSILLDDRLNLLKIILSNIDDKDEGTEYIHLFGSGYIDINTSKNACSILYSNSNIGLCNVLKEKSYISSYKIGKKKNIIIYNKVNR